MNLKYPAYFNQFHCPKCGKPFEPVVVNLSAEIVESNKDEKFPQRTNEYRDISIVVCGSCDTVIGVLPVKEGV